MVEDLDSVDIVVIGAGPAGCTAAEHAALRGAEVLVVERKEEIGIPVACGEFLPSIDEIKSIFPRAGDVDLLFDVPANLVSLKTDRLRLYSPGLRLFEIPFVGYTIDRDRFDKHLASKADKAGARIITGCSFLSLEDEGVITSLGKVRAKVVIGADGPMSRVASSLGLPANKSLYPAVTARAKGDFEPIPEMYFGNVAPGGYAWIIPKRGGANVGAGVSPRFAKGRISDYLKRFVERKGLDIDSPVGKFVPMSGPVAKTTAKRGLIVGDAAGHVMAVNGGGIPIAIICGRLAGETAAGNVTKGRSLEMYERMWRDQVEKPLRTAVRTEALASLCFGSQWRLGAAMRALGRRRMGRIIRCKPVLP
jgi:digeranylgeranylglycerophospholipid reductase